MPVAVWGLFFFFHEKNRLRSFFMKKNSGASDLFIRQSNRVLTALKAPIGRNAEGPGPRNGRLVSLGHADHSPGLTEVRGLGYRRPTWGKIVASTFGRVTLAGSSGR